MKSSRTSSNSSSRFGDPHPGWSTAWWRRKSSRSLLANGLAGVVLVAGALVLVAPFLWMLSTALKDFESAVAFPPRWIPRPVFWSNFAEAWAYLPFTLYLRNTLITSVVPLVGVVFTSSLVAYGFSRVRWRGRDFVFMLCLATMMLPPQVTLVPLFVLFQKLRWIDTFYPLVVPSYFGAGAGGAFYIFLLKQFFATIPMDLEDAARIDGCNSARTWFTIIMPLAKPGLATVAIFGFVRGWDDFMGPLIYLSSESKRTLVLGLAMFQQMSGIGGMSAGASINLLMAASVLVTLPPLILFAAAQRYFIQGIVLTGLKT